MFHVFIHCFSHPLQSLYKILILNWGVAVWSFKGIDFFIGKALAGFLTSDPASNLIVNGFWFIEVPRCPWCLHIYVSFCKSKECINSDEVSVTAPVIVVSGRRQELKDYPTQAYRCLWRLDWLWMSTELRVCLYSPCVNPSVHGLPGSCSAARLKQRGQQGYP